MPVVDQAPIREVGGIKIGVLGLSDPALARRFGWKSEDAAGAAQREAARLRSAGAEVVIALGAFERPMARQVARTGAVDIIVVGQNVGSEGLSRADQIEDSFIVAPADELQKVGRLETRAAGPGGRRAGCVCGMPADQKHARWSKRS